MGLLTDRILIANAIDADTSKGLASFGAGPWDGTSAGKFAGSAVGTLIAGNPPAAFAGNLLDLQLGGVGKFKVDSGGAIWQPTAAGALVKVPRFEELTFQLLASTVSQSIFIADDNYQVVGVQAVPNVAGGSGATVTVEVCTGTQAPGSGTAQLTAALALNGTINTVVAGTLVASPATVASGQRIGIVMAGTLTGLVGTITIAIQRV